MFQVTTSNILPVDEAARLGREMQRDRHHVLGDERLRTGLRGAVLHARDVLFVEAGRARVTRNEDVHRDVVLLDLVGEVEAHRRERRLRPTGRASLGYWGAAPCRRRPASG